jgi:uncharacterized protein YdbL (DUF1318 family)
MKHRSRIAIFLLTIGYLFICLSTAWAQDIKARMRARLPELVTLKAQGVVGENNKGYLTILKSPTPKEALVRAENDDRRKIYTAIAKKQGTTAALVGKRRALQIAEKADPGTMIQGADGKWEPKR